MVENRLDPNQSLKTVSLMYRKTCMGHYSQAQAEAVTFPPVSHN